MRSGGVSIYVDDFLLIYKVRSLAEKLETQIASRVQVKIIGRPKKFLGIRINFVIDRLELDQTKYIEFILKKFGLLDSRELSLPAVPGLKFRPNQGKQTELP